MTSWASRVVDAPRVDQLIAKLRAQGFYDDLGHPLSNCATFHELCGAAKDASDRAVPVQYRGLDSDALAAELAKQFKSGHKQSVMDCLSELAHTTAAYVCLLAAEHLTPDERALFLARLSVDVQAEQDAYRVPDRRG